MYLSPCAAGGVWHEGGALVSFDLVTGNRGTPRRGSGGGTAGTGVRSEPPLYWERHFSVGEWRKTEIVHRESRRKSDACKDYISFHAVDAREGSDMLVTVETQPAAVPGEVCDRE